MSDLSAATPAPVYNGSQPNPTSGTVNPEGYVDRELNKPSQTRSGLAAAAMRRLGGGVNPQQHSHVTHTPNPGVRPIRTSTGRIVNATRNPNVQGTPVGNHPQRAIITHSPQQPAQVTQPQQSAQPQQPAALPTGVPGNGQPAQIPLNPDIANMIAQQQAAETQNQLTAQQRMNDLLHANTEQQGLVNLNAPIQHVGIDSRFADRGFFNSSGRDFAQQQLSDSIARRLADLQNQATVDQRNYQEAVNSGNARLAQQMAADYQKNAQEWDALQPTMDLGAVNPNGTIDNNRLINDVIPAAQRDLVTRGAQISQAPARPAPKAPARTHGAGSLTDRNAKHPSQKKAAKK